MAAFSCMAIFASAKGDNTFTPVVAPLIQNTTPQTAATDEDVAYHHFQGVHLSGTITSSCGVSWTYTYDCYSGCTLAGTVSNMATLLQAINAACGTNTTTINLSFPQA